MENLLVELYDLKEERDEDFMSAQLAKIDYWLQLIELNNWSKLQKESPKKFIAKDEKFQSNMLYEGNSIKMINNIPVSNIIRKKHKGKRN